MPCPHWLYRWIDERGRIPWIVRKLWPSAHWCPAMDDLLLIDEGQVRFACFCDERDRLARTSRH